jgi:hypothetical protein
MWYWVEWSGSRGDKGYMWRMVEWWLTAWNRSNRRESCPVPFCPQQIPHAI